MLRYELEHYVNLIASRRRTSAWSRGVKAYALELIEDTLPEEFEVLEFPAFDFMNGASSWHDYSYGGCSLLFDSDIAERLCTPSELKRKDGGRLPPNSQESWLDVQTRALRQACGLIMKARRMYLQEAAGW